MTNPFGSVTSKLTSGQDALIQVCGDSTGEGMYGFAGNDPDYGWVGRLAMDLGTGYDVNVHFLGNVWTSGDPGTIAFNGYLVDTMLNTSSRGDAAPTLHMTNGSIGGSQATNLIGWIQSSNLIPDPNPDAVFTACGFNDVINGANLATRIQSLAAAVRTRCPDAAIIITTENRSVGTYPTSYFEASFSEMTSYYVGANLNLTPPLQQSTLADANVWVMDTQQAFPIASLTSLMATNDTVGGLHPNADGYQAQADWIYGFFPQPFAPTTVAQFKSKALGAFYPARSHVRVDSSFRHAIPRS